MATFGGGPGLDCMLMVGYHVGTRDAGCATDLAGASRPQSSSRRTATKGPTVHEAADPFPRPTLTGTRTRGDTGSRGARWAFDCDRFVETSVLRVDPFPIVFAVDKRTPTSWDGDRFGRLSTPDTWTRSRDPAGPDGSRDVLASLVVDRIPVRTHGSGLHRAPPRCHRALLAEGCA